MIYADAFTQLQVPGSTAALNDEREKWLPEKF